jgi:hypothetical protein
MVLLVFVYLMLLLLAGVDVANDIDAAKDCDWLVSVDSNNSQT